MKDLISLMRIPHYIKNMLIFLPLFFSGSFRNKELIIVNITGFLAFCLLTSAVYIFNDICDKEKDKMHSVKKDRPIASGKISSRKAYIFAVILLALSAGLLICGNLNNTYAIGLMGLYAILNIAYSLKLKNIPIIDVAIITAGLVIRLIYGGIISGIIISNWLYLTVMAISFYMGYGKRRNEILMQKNETREVLKHYTCNFLDKNMYISAALAIIFYSLWAIDISTKHTVNLVYSVPLVIIIIMKYSLDIEGESNGDPVEVLLSDKWLVALSIIYGLLLTFAIYFS